MGRKAQQQSLDSVAAVADGHALALALASDESWIGSVSAAVVTGAEGAVAVEATLQVEAETDDAAKAAAGAGAVAATGITAAAAGTPCPHLHLLPQSAAVGALDSAAVPHLRPSALLAGLVSLLLRRQLRQLWLP